MKSTFILKSNLPSSVLNILETLFKVFFKNNEEFFNLTSDRRKSLLVRINPVEKAENRRREFVN